MNTKTDGSFTLVDKASEEPSVVRKLEECSIFAFDCESVDLDRDHKISLINIALEDGSIYFIDVMALGGISTRLKAVLQNKNIKKLMYCCRADADSLFYQHNINLTGIIDMQVIQYVKENPSRQPGKPIFSFLRSVEKYLGQSRRQALESSKLRDYSVWGRRPIDDKMLRYVSTEISCFLPMKAAMFFRLPATLYEIESWSEKFADSRRKKPIVDAKNPYHVNGLMPVNVVKDAKIGDVGCTKCLVKLDASEFDVFQLRNNNQKCAVCQIYRPRPRYSR